MKFENSKQSMGRLENFEVTRGLLQSIDMKPEQRKIALDLKVEFATYSKLYNNDVMVFLSKSWVDRRLDLVFGSKRNLLLALGYAVDQIHVR